MGIAQPRHCIQGVTPGRPGLRSNGSHRYTAVAVGGGGTSVMLVCRCRHVWGPSLSAFMFESRLGYFFAKIFPLLSPRGNFGVVPAAVGILVNSSLCGSLPTSSAAVNSPSADHWRLNEN